MRNNKTELDKVSNNVACLSNAIDNAMQDGELGFPIEIFPVAIQELIHNAYETVGYNRDYLSAGILSVSATAIGNTVELDNGSYISNPILWLAIIGRPGTGKSHPLQFAKKPIEKKDYQAYKEYKILAEDFIGKEKENKERKPHCKKTILKDFTPEKLADTHQFNPHGLLIYKDELIGWINSFDQYKKGGDQQMYLELFNGNELTVDRITKDPIRIENTNVNILGGMQPDVLKGMAKNNRNQDGFLDRFLFVYPEINKPNLFTGEKISELNQENYIRIINNLLSAPAQTIIASDAAIEIFKVWQHQKAEESFKDHLETAVQAKLETYVWRLALVLEMMQQGSIGVYNDQLTEKSMHDAIKLVEYFRSNTFKVHDKILVKNPLEGLTATQLDLYDALPNEFKRVEVIGLIKQKNLSLRSGDRFLNNDQLFYNFKTSKGLKQGQYKKKYV